MNFIDTEIDSQMRWLGIFVVGCLTTIIGTMIIYYNLIENTHIALGLSLIPTAFIAYYMTRKIEIEKDA
jgi:hypothetical protein